MKINGSSFWSFSKAAMVILAVLFLAGDTCTASDSCPVSLSNAEFPPAGFDNQGCVPGNCPPGPVVPLLGQSFLAESCTICGVQFKFAGCCPDICNNFFGPFRGGNFVLADFDSGQILARQAIPLGVYSGETDFFFAEPVEVVPGQKYIIGLEPFTQVTRFGWLLQTDGTPCTWPVGDTYPHGGQAWLEGGQGRETTRDFYFQIYGQPCRLDVIAFVEEDLFQVRVSQDMEPEQPTGEFLFAVLELPEGLSGAEVDPDTVFLEDAEGPLVPLVQHAVLEDRFIAAFPLSLETVSRIVGGLALEVESDHEARTVAVRVGGQPDSLLDLCLLHITGSLLDGRNFSGRAVLEIRVEP